MRISPTKTFPEVEPVMRPDASVFHTSLHAYRESEQWYEASRQSRGGKPSHSQYRMPDAPGLLGFAADIAARLGAVAACAETARGDALKASISVFGRKSAVSSKPDVAATANERARNAVYAIEIERLAAPQKNEGKALDASAVGGIPAGGHRLAITVGSRSAEAHVQINAYDTNATALGKLRDAIRGSGVGVHADVVKDSAAGTVRLRLTAGGTGSDFAFTVRDIRGTAAAAGGIAAPSEPAVNARYRINGGSWRESSSNTIVLDNGNVLAALRAAGGGVVHLSVGLDAADIAARVKTMAESYNSLLSAVEAASDILNPIFTTPVLRIAWQLSGRNVPEHARSEREAPERDLSAPIRLEPYRLAQVGITGLADGSLSVDETQLLNVLTHHSDAVKRAITGPNGIAAAIERAAASLASGPTSALLHPAIRNLQNSYPFYTAHQQVVPAWIRWPGLHLNTMR